MKGIWSAFCDEVFVETGNEGVVGDGCLDVEMRDKWINEGVLQAMMMLDEKIKSAIEEVKVVTMKKSPSIVFVLMESSVEGTARHSLASVRRGSTAFLCFTTETSVDKCLLFCRKWERRKEYRKWGEGRIFD